MASTENLKWVIACTEGEEWAAGLWGPAAFLLLGTVSQQPDVVYGPSCPLWVCLWIPIERRIMATPG